jgi:predicted choloylglycine hydrolase
MFIMFLCSHKSFYYIIRYILNNGTVTERCTKFLTKVGHKVIDMESAIL